MYFFFLNVEGDVNKFIVSFDCLHTLSFLTPFSFRFRFRFTFSPTLITDPNFIINFETMLYVNI